jgi:adenine-specific DNA-methyltransferase
VAQVVGAGRDRAELIEALRSVVRLRQYEASSPGKHEESRGMPKHQGRLELTWTDKDKTLLSSGDGRYDYTFVDPSDYRVSEVRLLHEVERVEAGTPAERPVDLPAPTTDNLLITGDAMHALDAIAKTPEYAERYLGKVKLVYIDPPFNTGQAFAHYEDNIEHSIWLTMLRDRLRQIKPLLSGDASVWVHLDDAEVHRCRAVMDEELGAEKFIATIVWEKSPGSKGDTDIADNHDYILVYAVGGKAWKSTRNRVIRSAKQSNRYANPDGDPRGPWRQGADGTAKSGNEDLKYEVVTPSGRVVVPPKGNFWRFSRATLDRARSEGRVWFGKNGDAMPIIKTYLADISDGVVPGTWWPNGEVGSNQEAKRDHLRKLFPEIEPFSTPKPERLLQRIIHIATNPGDVVLDCFAGSGTTAAVAHKMGRRWVTSELLSETTETFTKPRLAKVVYGADPGGITTTTERVAVDGVDLPEGMSAEEAREFNALLSKAVKALGEQDPVAIRALRATTRTRDERTTNWHGGGGFTHLRVGPSMFVEVDGMILLADWATHGELSRAMCAQLGVRYRPDGIFAGRRGRTRYVVVDGMVGESTVASIVDRLEDTESVEVWATQIDDGAGEALRAARPGSRVEPIPDAVLDNYRRKSAAKSPFGGGAKKEDEGDA